MRRYALRDDQWERIKDSLPGRLGHVGCTANDNRQNGRDGLWTRWDCGHGRLSQLIIKEAFKTSHRSHLQAGTLISLSMQESMGSS